MTSSVTIAKVSKRFGRVEAVRDVSFGLNEGEVVALVGHNGAGKTTLMKLMLGLARPSSGEIRVLGENPAAGACGARRHLGYLPESIAFNGALTGRETLSFYARLKGVPVAAALDVLASVGLTKAARRRIATYSKGMRQRLGLAQALLGAPRVLLLDEPTSGLDPEFRQTFYQMIRDLRNGGTAILLSSHALTELEERADRVVIMKEGSVLAKGTLAELRRLADLPNRIVARMAAGVPCEKAAGLVPAPSLCRMNGHSVEVICSAGDKMAIVRRLVGEGAGVIDIETIPPSLDELYAHFLHHRDRRQ